MSRTCFDYKQGTFKFIDVDDATITVQCDQCGVVHTLEPDGLDEGGFEWIEALETLNKDPDTGELLDEGDEEDDIPF